MKKIITKASILSTALSNQFIILTFNIILFIIIAKSFSTNELAAWAIFQSVTTIVDMIKVGFIQNSLINQLKSNPENKYNIIKSTLFVYGILSIISFISVVVIFYLISKYNSNSYEFEYVLYYLFSIIGIGVLQFINIIKQSNEEHKVIAKNNLFWVLISFIIISNLYYFESIKPSNILIATGISASIVSLYYIKKHISYIIKASIEKNICYKIIDFGKYVFGTNLLSMIINKSDIFILSIYSQPSSLAAYHIAIRIANYLEIPLNAAAQVYYPKLHNAFSDKKKLDKVISDSLLIQWMYIIPAALLLFTLSENIIGLISGSNYITESSTLLRIIILASFIKPIGRTMGIVLDIKNRPDLNLKILIFSGILFLGLELYLGKNYSSTGIAIAYVLASWISIITSQVFINNKINFSVINPIYILLTNKLKNKTI
jgi:O-antigen/teichoic acid export membrane protein